MIEIFNVKPDAFNSVLAEHLKSTDKLTLPKNVDIVKTCHGKQRAPADKDWYYKRAASIIRKMVVATHRGEHIGVTKLSRKYGCSKNRGSRPSKHVDGARGHIRKILQDLEKAEWVVTDAGDRKISDLAMEEMRQLIGKIRE